MISSGEGVAFGRGWSARTSRPAGWRYWTCLPAVPRQDRRADRRAIPADRNATTWMVPIGVCSEESAASRAQVRGCLDDEGRRLV